MIPLASSVVAASSWSVVLVEVGLESLALWALLLRARRREARRVFLRRLELAVLLVMDHPRDVKVG